LGLDGAGAGVEEVRLGFQHFQVGLGPFLQPQFGEA